MKALLLLSALALGAPAPAKAPKAPAPRPKAVELRVKTSDGWELTGSWRAAGKKRGVVLLHGLASQKEEWAGLADALAAKGVSSLALDLRGHGGGLKNGRASGWQGFADRSPAGEWASMWKDAEAGLSFLKEHGVKKRGVGGASVGANAALAAAARLKDADFLVLLSPGLDYQSIRTDSDIAAYGPRPLLMAAAPNDAYAYGSVELLAKLRRDAGLPSDVLSASTGHGVQMFSEPGVLARVAGWIAQR